MSPFPNGVHIVTRDKNDATGALFRFDLLAARQMKIISADTGNLLIFADDAGNPVGAVQPLALVGYFPLPSLV